MTILRFIQIVGEFPNLRGVSKLAGSFATFAKFSHMFGGGRLSGMRRL